MKSGIHKLGKSEVQAEKAFSLRFILIKAWNDTDFLYSWGRLKGTSRNQDTSSKINL